MNNDHSKKFVEWLGYTANPKFLVAAPLGIILGGVITIALFCFLVAAVSVLWQFMLAGIRAGAYSNDIEGVALRNIGLVLLGLFGAPFVAWRGIIAAKQARISEEALLNEKVNEAANKLAARYQVSSRVLYDQNEAVLNEWCDDLVLRAAAMDRLEGLALEHKDLAPRVVRLLATYIRGNFEARSLEITEPPFVAKIPRMDLQKAIDTIGRIHRIAVEEDPSHWRLDMKGCDFDGVSFRSGFFWAVDFRNCRFELSDFGDATLEGCLFSGSLLNYANFRRTNLIGARLSGIILNRPIPSAGGMVFSINLGDIRGVNFIAADISAIDYLGESDVISNTFATRDTLISEAVRERMLSKALHHSAHVQRSSNRNAKTDEAKNAIQALEETGFQHWSPYESGDMATSFLLDKFQTELGMKHWPYV